MHDIFVKKGSFKETHFSNQMTSEMAGFVQETVTSCIMKNAGVSSNSPTHENFKVV